MEVLLQREVLPAGVERGVEVGEFLQCRNTGLHQEGEHGELDARLLVFLVQRHPQRFQVGDVGVVVLGDVRDHRPVARQVGAGDLLDARQRDDFGLAELAEVHLRPRQQVEPATGCAGCARRGGRCGHAPGQRALDVLLHVFLADAATALAARHLVEVHAQFAREQAHGRAGVGDLLRQHAVGIEFDRRRARRRGFRVDARLVVQHTRGRGGHGRGGAFLRDFALGDLVGGRGYRDRLDLRAGFGSPRRGGRGGRRCIGRAFADFDQRHHGAFGDLVAQLDLDVLHHACERGRDFHRGLVRLQRDQALVLLHRVAHGHQDLDHRHAVVVTDIGDFGFLDVGHGVTPVLA